MTDGIPSRSGSTTQVDRGQRTRLSLVMGSVVLLMCVIASLIVARFILLLAAAPIPSAVKVIEAAAPTHTSVFTPVPVRAKEPTRAPATRPSGVTSAAVTAVVIEPRVNVRSSPSTQAKIIGKVQKDDRLTVIGRNADSTWYKVSIAGVAGPNWVFAETCTIANGSVESLPVVQP